MDKIAVVFEGIDSWNRPVFKSIISPSRYGSVDVLFDDDATEEDVLAVISEADLVWFGNSWDCEPMGYQPPELIIYRKAEVGNENR